MNKRNFLSKSQEMSKKKHQQEDFWIQKWFHSWNDKFSKWSNFRPIYRQKLTVSMCSEQLSKQQQPLQFLEGPVHEGYIVTYDGYLLVHGGYIWVMRVIFWFKGGLYVFHTAC